VSLLRAWLTGIPAYLWSGWGAIASLFLLLAAWEGVSLAYGSLILPDPASTFATLARTVRLRRGLAGTGRPPRAAPWPGWRWRLLAGSLLGLAAGVSMTASMMSRPLVTVLLGTPPIAWLVLAMLWFGVGDGTPVFTVFIACFPVVFIGACRARARSIIS
jgi:NitT/TauT family transport system permease protein